jgi:hypothetical protein
VLLIALVLGFTGAAWLLRGPATPAAPGGPGEASSAAVPTASLVSTSSSGATGAVQSPTASTAAPTATTTPSQTSPTATITFNDLKLDPSIDPAGAARTFTFVSDGPGVVSAHVVVTSLNDSSEMCLTQDALPAKCTSGPMPGFDEVASSAQTHWKVTVLSMNESSPTVDVAFSWPTEKPVITATNCRFQGSPNLDTLRSLVATFKPRVAGNVTLDAAWPPAIVHATLKLTDVTGPNPSPVDSMAYVAAGSVSPQYSHSVASDKTYQISLFNDSADAGRPNLTATIALP